MKALLVLLFLFSCTKSEVKKIRDSSSNNFRPPTPTPTTTNPTIIGSGCYTRYSGSDKSEYLQVPAIFQGQGGRSTYQNPNWSSNTDPYFANDNETLLRTDDFLNMRIVVKPSPGGGPAHGDCPLMASPYTKLSFRLEIVNPDPSASAPFFFRDFNRIAVDNCTPKIELPVPSSNDPIRIQISNVKWDWCTGGVGTCEEDFVWYDSGHGAGHCVELELQIATPQTKDIP